MDPRFVSDMVRTIPHDAEIQLNLADGNTPVLFRVGSSYRYVVMPLLRDAAISSKRPGE
jgi:hypothetical protein